MNRYGNLGGRSGIRSFEIGLNYIRVQFSDFALYEYTINSVGEHHLERMKNLALRGTGLNSFINRFVKNRYSRKIR